MDNPKTVCFLTASYPADYSRFLDREARSLQKAGYRVIIIGLGKHTGVFTKNGIKIFQIKEQRGFSKINTMRDIAGRALDQRAEIYHCFDPWALWIGFKIKKRCPQVKLIYDSTEWFPQTYLDRKDFPWLLRLIGWGMVTYLEYRATQQADEIIETNRLRSTRFFRRKRIPKLVPNYAPVELVKAPLNQRDTCFVYTGLICRPRGFDRLLQAIATVKVRYPSVRLLVRGEFDPYDDFESWSRDFIRANRLVENVQFVERVDSYSDVFELLKPCLAGVILLQPDRGNDWTNQPSKLFEFMVAGLAVIASNFPEISRIVQSSGCGWLVDSRNSAEIARTMEQILANPAEAIKRGLAGRKMAQTKYNWEFAAQTLLSIYQRLTGGLSN